MSKRQSSKYKINRRLSVNLWGRPKSPFNIREYGPGQHGQRRRKVSDYGTQLRAKQQLRGYYGNINERQFRRVYKEAVRARGDTSEQLIGLLERRLDIVVYRMLFVPTVFAARQLISHGHVMVNGKRVNIPSYRLQEGNELLDIAVEVLEELLLCFVSTKSLLNHLAPLGRLSFGPVASRDAARSRATRREIYSRNARFLF